MSRLCWLWRSVEWIVARALLVVSASSLEATTFFSFFFLDCESQCGSAIS